MFKSSVAGQDHVTARKPREQTDHTSLRLLWSVTAYLHCRTPIQGPTAIRIPNPVVKNMFTLHRLRLWSLLPISAQKSELGSESVSSNLIMQLHRLRSGSLSGLRSPVATVLIFGTDMRTWIGTRVRIRQ